MDSPNQSADAEVLAKIETVFENIADSLLSEENPYVPLKDIFIPLRYKKRVISESNMPKNLPTDPLDGLTRVSFPARGRPKEAWRFTVIIRILDLIHEALCDNVIVSKRNIYYKDPALFKTQMTVDYYVDIIAYTFGVSRLALNVTAAAKGLVAGNLTLTRTDGTQVRKKPDLPHLIDDPHDVQTIDISDVAWILVVEKESTFRTLVSGNLHQSSRAGNGMILTAKGYPDISTRSFLRLLSTSHDPNGVPPPIYALTDFDPDGLAIMSIYKHGSMKLSHENAGLNVPSIQWLGVRSRDVLPGNGGWDESPSGPLLKLSARDRKKAFDMLERCEVFREDGAEGEWRRELQVMLMLNVKAEMEVLAEREGGVKAWVENKTLEAGARLQGCEDWSADANWVPRTMVDGDRCWPGLQQGHEEELLLDVHETSESEMSLLLGGESASLQGDDDLLDTHQMADISFADEDLPGLEWDEEL